MPFLAAGGARLPGSWGRQTGGVRLMRRVISQPARQGSDRQATDATFSFVPAVRRETNRVGTVPSGRT